MSKKKEHHEEHVDETWLIPYADMLTLLLALFIVMFAMSKVDQTKFESVKRQLNIVFAGGAGVFDENSKDIKPFDLAEPSSSPPPENTPPPSEDASGSGISSGTTGTQGIKDAEKEKAYAAEDAKMQEIKKLLEEQIKQAGYADQVKIELNREGLDITVQDVVLFESGDDRVIRSSYPLLQQIGKALSTLNNNMKVTGHSDNIPISYGKFRSNWDLSAFRAINVMEYLVTSAGLKQEKFSVQAYGEFKPKFDNATADGRAKNRRVEIFVIRSQN